MGMVHAADTTITTGMAMKNMAITTDTAMKNMAITTDTAMKGMAIITVTKDITITGIITRMMSLQAGDARRSIPIQRIRSRIS